MDLVINKPLPIAENLEFRDVVKKLEDCMLNMPDKINVPVDTPCRHFFCDKLYAREVFIPAGTAIIGKIHAKEHICIVSSGFGIFASEEGSQEIRAPSTWISLPNAKRVIYVIEDMVMTTLHPNQSNTQDMDELEANLITKTHILEQII